MPGTRLASFLLLAATAVAVVYLRAGSMLLAGLFSYIILDVTHRKIKPLASPKLTRWATLVVFIVAATALSLTFARFFKVAIMKAPELVDRVLPKMNDFAADHGLSSPIGTADDIKPAVLNALKSNAGALTKAGGLLTKDFLRLLVAVIVAVLCFLSPGPPRSAHNLADLIAIEFDARIDSFLKSFELVMLAQVLVSAVNTLLIAVFALATGLPNPQFVILATFVLGIIPVAGLIAANVILLAAALAVSLKTLLAAAIFLFVIHHFLYLLTGRVIGARTKLPMWQVLLGLLIGEMVMGIAGMLLAPAVLHYVREELASFPADRASSK